MTDIPQPSAKLHAKFLIHEQKMGQYIQVNSSSPVAAKESVK